MYIYIVIYIYIERERYIEREIYRPPRPGPLGEYDIVYLLKCNLSMLTLLGLLNVIQMSIVLTER